MMKIPENTEQISIGNGKVNFLDKEGKIIFSECLNNLNCSSFMNKNEFMHFDAINCSCNGHMLTLSVFDDDFKDDYVYINSWNKPGSLPYTLWYRIKTAFQVLCGKFPFIDEYLFTKDQLLVFRALLDKYIKILQEKKLKNTK